MYYLLTVMRMLSLDVQLVCIQNVSRTALLTSHRPIKERNLSKEAVLHLESSNSCTPGWMNGAFPTKMYVYMLRLMVHLEVKQ